MARIEPDVRRRLQQAALELYRDRGYDRTTTAEIAERAGVSERTFFRYFPDKREVLFDGQAKLSAALTSAIDELSLALEPLETLYAAFRSIEKLLEHNRSFSEPRQQVIAQTPALQERELAKVAALTLTLAKALQERGVDAALATLAANAGMIAFDLAVVHWLEDGSRGLGEHLEQTFRALRSLTAGLEF